MNTPKITQSLHLKQAQQLVMTPQLQQAIKLLQMNNLELDAFLDAELERNPLLEKEEADQNTDESDTSDTESETPETDTDDLQDSFDDNWGPDTPTQDFDAGVDRIGAGGGALNSFDDPDNPLENTLQTQKSLRDHLHDQLQQSCADPTDQRLGALLIDMIDEAGYLRLDNAELTARLGIAPARLDHILTILRGFDPAGIFARDLPDCLRLQLIDRGAYDAPMAALLDHLDLIARHEHGKLAKICGVNDTYLRDMLAELKTLSPKPAGAFDHMVVQTAIPDVLMKTLPKNLGGGWRVELNTTTLPRVLINNTYYTDVLGRAKTAQDKSYLTTQMNEANWLVRALDQRAQTILKVAAEIVERQHHFFLFGLEYLAPMTLKDIAEAIDMHESTISRVTNGKFIGTPRGIFELKFFFTTAIAGADGGVHSAESVKLRIKTLIDNEHPDAVLSDDKIADMLEKEGVHLARRTVAKYREEMNIPSSSDRRKIMKNKGL